METGLLPTFNSQLLHLDKINGSRTLAIDFIKALLYTLDTYEGDTAKDKIIAELMDLYNLLLACRPRMAMIVADLQRFIVYLKNAERQDLDAYKELLRGFLAEIDTQLDSIASGTMSLFSTEKTLLLHSFSHTIQRILTEAVKENRVPKIYVAAQDHAKTAQVIRGLQDLQLAFSVVSEYAVSHILDDLDVALFGCLSLTSKQEIIMGPGSGSLISQLNHAKVATYAILSTNKFSFWEESWETTHKEFRSKQVNGRGYEKQVYSHDIVPFSLITGIITENGVLNTEEALNLFKTLQEKYFEVEREIRSMAR